MSTLRQNRPDLADLVARSRDLYSLPAVAMKVLQLTECSKVNAQALKECIEMDPALTAKLLRVVNSSLFGLSRRVSDLNQALAMLGTKPLKLLVLGFSLPDSLFRDAAGDILAHYWRHTLTKAIAARELSQVLWNTPGDDAFIAAMLQDLGQMVLLQDVGRPYADLLRDVAAQRDDLLDRELDTLGFDHTVLSARLLDHWGLPRSLVELVAGCGDKQPTLAMPIEQLQTAKTLFLSELFARLLADQQVGAFGRLFRFGHDHCELEIAQLGPLVESLEEKVIQLADVLALQLDDGEDYSSIMEKAREQTEDVRSELELSLSSRCDESLSSAVTVPPPLPCQRSQPPDPHRPTDFVDQVTDATTISPVTEPTGDSGPVFDDSGAASGNTTTAIPAIADPGLEGRLHYHVESCRQTRSSLSLVLVEIDRYEDVVQKQGLDQAHRLPDMLATAPQVNPDSDFVQLSDARFAAILPDCDRLSAIDVAHQMIQRVQDWSRNNAQTRWVPVTVSAAVATLDTPPCNFDPANLTSAAERCLFAARSAGGNSVKSIEL